MNLLHIVEGWGKGLGLWDVTAEDAALSMDRMNICAVCPKAKHSKFLAFLKGGAHDVDGVYCGLCGCPVNEKTLVGGERCPEGKW